MRDRLPKGLTLGWALVPLLGAAAPALAQSNAEMELLELNRRLFETQILEQDPTLLRSVSDESYVVIAPGGVIESREQVIAGLGAFVSVDSISIGNERVVRSGATAIVLNRLVIHGPLQGPVGEVDLGPMSVMTVFSRDGAERWSVVSRALATCHPAALERGIC
ncbi:MAG: nuclear transport factor 2 family protein [Gemmatimonadota bacterium]